MDITDRTHQPIWGLDGVKYIIKYWRSKEQREPKRNCIIALARLSRSFEVKKANRDKS